jgi:hypothetical protein
MIKSDQEHFVVCQSMCSPRNLSANIWLDSSQLAYTTAYFRKVSMMKKNVLLGVNVVRLFLHH